MGVWGWGSIAVGCRHKCSWATASTGAAKISVALPATSLSDATCSCVPSHACCFNLHGPRLPAQAVLLPLPAYSPYKGDWCALPLTLPLPLPQASLALSLFVQAPSWEAATSLVARFSRRAPPPSPRPPWATAPSSWCSAQTAARILARMATRQVCLLF